MLEQAITITDAEITLLGQYFIHRDYTFTRRDVILDILSRYYCDQHICIKLLDGENGEFSGFVEFMKDACNIFSIPYDRVTIETHDPDPIHPFCNRKLKLGIFISANQYLPEINRDLTSAKFVGSLLGRYNISRLRLAYELDSAFTGDTFITFQSTLAFLEQQLKPMAQFYQKELAWLSTKSFARDLTSPHHMGMIDWQTATANYSNVWNKYQIEVVSETDAHSDFWFTEKTANCLATGKPFVLVAGQNSLKRLRSMGFQTFDTVIDESYDSQKEPTSRISRLISSLQEVYNSPRRDALVAELYNLAEKNIELYRSYSKR